MLLIFIPLIIGSVFIILSLILKAKQNSLLKNSVVVYAKVTQVVKGTSYTSSIDDVGLTTIHYTPTFEFIYQGKPYSIKYNVSYPKPTFEIGQHVDLNFNPDIPNQVVLCNDKLTSRIYLLFLFMGILIFILGLFLIKLAFF
jgi:hypothetical protein